MAKNSKFNSILLAVMMIASMFLMVPVTASAQEMKTVYVGVINYLSSADNLTNGKVRYWGGASDPGDATLTRMEGITMQKSVGSSFWNGEAQTFYMYQTEVPADATGFKVHIGDTWFGDDGSLSSSNAAYVFNYGGDKALYDNYPESTNPDDPNDPNNPQPTAADYYLVGSMTGWVPGVEDYKFAQTSDGLYVLRNVTLTSDDQLKVVGIKDNETTWYPDYGENYEITQDGTYKIFFNPNGGVDGWYGGYFIVLDVNDPDPTVPEPTPADYYLVGTMNNWTTGDANYIFTQSTEDEGLYVLNVSLTANTELKVVDSNGTWYPNFADNYVISTTGTYNISFRPDGQGGEGWYEGYFLVAPVVNDLINATVSDLQETYEYDGNDIILSYTVTDPNGTELEKGTDYDAEITKDGSAVTAINHSGEYILTLTGKGNYHGSKTLSFTVSPKPYTITYVNAVDGENGVTNTNPTSYTVESETITLVDPTRPYYTFAGWYDNEALSGDALTDVTIATGSTGNKTFYAKWTPDQDFSINDAGTEYTIHTATGWGRFCDLLEGGETFSGKTVKLDASIGTAQDPVTRMAGSTDHRFGGTFDGGGNTLTFTCTANSNYVAPFAYVKGGNSANGTITICNLNVLTTITATDFRHVAGLIALQAGHVNVTSCNAEVHLNTSKGTNNTDLYPAGLVSQASSSDGGTLTVSGCTSTGTISTNGKYAAGMVGIVQGTTTITNSVSSVTINSSTDGDGTHGGFVAVSYPGSTTFEGCLFNGKLLTVGTTDTGNCGGFVGWRNTGSITIKNSLYAPATLDNGEKEVVTGTNDFPSCTFSRHWDGTPSNSYYTRVLGTAQGTQARNIKAGENVTVDFSGTATGTYDVSGITAYAKGLKYNDMLYVGNGDAVSLTLGNTPPTGFALSGYTVSPDGTTLNGTENPYTLTMPDEGVTISATFTQAPVAYYDPTSGETKYCSEYTVLTGEETSLTTAGWYVVNHDISYTGTLSYEGEVNLILCDGYTMTIGTSDNRINGHGLYDSHRFNSVITTTIYGQSQNTGTLSVFTTGDLNNAIYPGDLVINGGHIIADANGWGGIAICSAASYEYNNYGDITINGGIVEATAAIGDAICAGKNFRFNGGIVTASTEYNDKYAIDLQMISKGYKYFFNWRNPDDQITIGAGGLNTKNYDNNKIGRFIKAFIDEDGNIYKDDVTGATLATLTGKTLRAYDPAGYYLVGTMTNWGLTPNYQLTKNNDNEGEYMIKDVELTSGTEFKVGYSTDGSDVTTWYPGDADNYTVPADGTYDIYFRPDYQGGEDWYSGCIYVSKHPADVTLGDANGDGDVDIADVTAIINFINNDAPATFNATAADVNQDGTIDIGDVTGVINIINK